LAVLKDESSTGFARHFFRSLFISSAASSEVKVQIEKLKLKARLRICSTRAQLLIVIILGSKNVGKLTDPASLFELSRRGSLHYIEGCIAETPAISSTPLQGSLGRRSWIFAAGRFKSAENRLTEFDDSQRRLTPTRGESRQ
jgi:hypothetical protein